MGLKENKWDKAFGRQQCNKHKLRVSPVESLSCVFVIVHNCEDAFLCACVCEQQKRTLKHDCDSKSGKLIPSGSFSSAMLCGKNAVQLNIFV